MATCSTAGYLGGLGLGVGHFSHVFVDEAGQATEPECLLPVGMLACSTGHVSEAVGVTSLLICVRLVLLAGNHFSKFCE